MPEYPELPILPSKHEMHLWLTTAFADRLVVTPHISGARPETEESRQALEPTAPPVRPGPGPAPQRSHPRPLTRTEAEGAAGRPRPSPSGSLP
ncbi:hypothetical protein [Streptomyces mirabilis]|uniref:hypothetical protein n=1 Tax=Streptomyces mirabilis TaxID=68239 RepID=UPI0034465EEC